MSRQFMARAIGLFRMLAVLGLSLGVLWGLSGDTGLAQTGSNEAIGAGAEAMTAAMGAPPRAMDRAPYAALLPAGAAASDSSDDYAISALGLVELPQADVDGGGGTGASSNASAVASTSAIDLFGGRVRANGIQAHARADVTAGQAHVSGDATIEGLVIDNVTITAVQIGQSIPLPGIGTIVAREVELDPSGQLVTVHALRIVGSASSGPLRGSQLVIARASAGIPSVALAPPGVAAVPRTGVLRPGSTLTPFEPIDLTSAHTSVSTDDSNDNFSFNKHFSSDDDDDDDDNDNSSSHGTHNDFFDDPNDLDEDGFPDFNDNF